jgi:hypothetical protein
LVIVLLGIGVGFYIKNDICNNKEIIVIPIKSLLITGIILALWVAYSGMGGYFYQTNDNQIRNAILRDLIDYSWPVKYPETGNTLVYYFAFWIVPALVGKLFGWTAANFALYLWGLFGILLIYLHIVKYVATANKVWHYIILAIFLVGWSGENLLGLVVSNWLGICDNPIFIRTTFGFEGWLDFTRNGYPIDYLYRSNVDALCQVYNQAIVPWLVTMIVLDKPKTRNFAFLGLCALCYGPIPFIGMLPIFICLFIDEMLIEIKKRNFKFVFKEIFSVPNVMACITIFPIMCFFFSMNIAFSGTSNVSIIETSVSTSTEVAEELVIDNLEDNSYVEDSVHYIKWYVPLEAYDLQRVLSLLLFYALEFGIYAVFIWKKYKKNRLFRWVLVTLAIIPFFQVGEARDLCMNASLPGLFILMVYAAKYIIEEYRQNFPIKKAFNYVGLVIALAFSLTTLVGDFAAKCSIMQGLGDFPHVEDDYITFSDKMYSDNFLVPMSSDSIFLLYLIK